MNPEVSEQAAAAAAAGSDAAHYQRWLRQYQPPAGRHDELLTAGGRVRAPWARFLAQLSKLRPHDFEHRWEQARKLLVEHGVTYNVYGDPEGQERPWELDPVPLVLGADDWATIEQGLIQRATLFDRLLRDIYGPRQTLADGLLPPEIVFANERFLRPCVGLPAAGGRHLPFYAADLARSPDGQWWVVSDRTQAPSGMGYALENRIVIGRALMPEVARECQLVRLAGFFDHLRETLAAAAPRPTAQPHVVLLSPGPLNETYFEQAYLARYLGITLAEGEDLTVREDRVFLKTLEGLRPVDVIWRRVDEGFADPLELRSDSQLGVSGLLQAIRAGNVTVLNPPGSGVVEAPALMAFLPGLCERLLGEPLRIPSVATWWCGQEKPCREALSQLDRLVVKHAFRKGSKVSYGRSEDPEGRAALTGRILDDPRSWVAQEEIPYSTSPVWGGHGFEPRQVTMRVFLVAEGDSYVVMPGGLTRVAGESQSRPGISMQRGSGSKDTWVLSDRAHEPQLPSVRNRFPVVIRRSPGQFSSRVADNLYWIGRYAERSEFATRLLRGVIGRISAESGFGAIAEIGPLWDYLILLGHLEAPMSHREPAAQGFAPLELALKAAVFDPKRMGSLLELNSQLLRLGRVSRDALSLDTWRIVRRLGENLREWPSVRRLGDLMPLLDRLVNLHAALSGLAQENTTRTPGWAFLDLGRRLERSLYATGLGQTLLEAPDADRRAALDAVLEVFDSAITYRQRYFFEPRLLPVLDTLFVDPANPRSLAFQVERLDSHLASLPTELRQPHSTQSRGVTTRALERLRATDLGARDVEEERQRLGAMQHFLDCLGPELESISDDLTRQYFSLLRPEQFAPEAPR